MSRSPLQAQGSKDYADAWRAINILIRSDGTWSGRERNLCFRNRGDGTFEDISFASGLDLDADGRAFVPLDLDGDGDSDLVVKNRNGRQLRAFRNDLNTSPTRTLDVRLEGRESNHEGIGARVWVETDKRSLMREVTSGSGYLSQRSREARFALAKGETVRSVRVRWPGGTEQDFTDPPASGKVLLVEGSETFRELPLQRSRPADSEAAGSLAQEPGPGTWLAEPLPAPEFDLREIAEDGGTVKLSQMRGQPVLLNFWATWCPPCRAELASFQRVLGELTRAGIEILAVSVDEPGNAAAVQRLAADLGLDYPVLLADSKTAEAYSVLNESLFDRRRALAIPTSFLVDAEGRIQKVYRGEVDPESVLRDVKAGGGAALPFAGRWVSSGPRRDFEELGAAYAERGLGAAARSMFDEALARGIRTPMLLNNLAGALISDGETERGEALLREALEADSHLTDAKVNLAALLIKRGEHGEAERWLEEILTGQPTDAQALSALGNARFAQGRLEDAEALFRKAVEVQPEHAGFRENLGAALASLGQLDGALREYEGARDLGATGSNLHTNLGVLYIQTGRAEQALAAFLKAVEASPKDPGTHLNLAQYRLQANDFEQSLESIRRAEELAPGNLGTLLLKARALAMSGRQEEARRTAQDAVRRYPAAAEAAELVEALR